MFWSIVCAKGKKCLLQLVGIALLKVFEKLFNLIRIFLKFCLTLSVPFWFFQILIRGFAYGGISEIDESNHYSCKMGRSIAAEIGQFGHKPTVLAELLAGKYVSGRTTLGYYTRSFQGDCAKADLEAALQVKSSQFHDSGF